MIEPIDISQFDYPLAEDSIARYPLEDRSASKLLVWEKGDIKDAGFSDLGRFLPRESFLVFNNTRVVRARLLMYKPTGARIEILCLEPYEPADYERAFASTESCSWRCMVGNSKKWRNGPLEISFLLNDTEYLLRAEREDTNNDIVQFTWNAPLTFGQLLEHLGRVPIPPYLERESEDIDKERYQTVYASCEGSVAAPTAGLHFTPGSIRELSDRGFSTGEITLHVGAGTFLPVKEADATRHLMHTEHFSVTTRLIDELTASKGKVVAVGTTTVRTLESLAVLGTRILKYGDPVEDKPVGQWEAYGKEHANDGSIPLEALSKWLRASGKASIDASTNIMVAPGYTFRVVNGLITNFHQPKSTLLLLVSAFTAGRWGQIYHHAISSGYRFLSYGDSSLLIP